MTMREKFLECAVDTQNEAAHASEMARCAIERDYRRAAVEYQQEAANWHQQAVGYMAAAEACE
jgi:hypothetical protein